MKNNREKIGQTNIDWKSVAFGIGKNRRKTIGFGEYNKKTREYEEEFYIRELSIVDGGIGCALWDASIILSRWIKDNPDYFKDKEVIELGAGAGLPGIVCSKHAKFVYLTDYLENVISNMEYNIKLNQREENCKALMLDWTNLKDVPLKEQSFDIIIGSELTYTGDEKIIKALCIVIDKYLKEDGIFLEVLSDDRDGVTLFLEEFSKYGFGLNLINVDKHVGNFGTKQKEESYKLYEFKRK